MFDRSVDWLIVRLVMVYLLFIAEHKLAHKHSYLQLEALKWGMAMNSECKGTEFFFMEWEPLNQAIDERSYR